MSLFGAASPSHSQSAKSSPADVRRNNRQLIFSLLFPTNQYSRADLGRLTGLSRVAVSDVVGQMLDEGLLRETGQAPSGGKGKRGTLLSIDIDRLNIVSLDLTQDHMLHGAVTNLLGQALRHAEITLGAGERVTLEMIGELIEKMMSMAEGTVIGVGIASPGVVDGGVVKRSTWLDWHDMDLSTPLQERFGTNVTVTNDATAAMLTERFFGQGDKNMIFVRIESGIGSAILINDTPVKGEMHAAGEIGHISIDLNGPECPCGKRGCLETMISDNALRKQLVHADEQQKVSILAQAGQHLGQALSMPVGLLDMADVCVYGQPDIVNATFIDAAQQYLDASTSSTFHKHTVIRRCECGSDITVQGEAIAVLVHYLSQ
ncbi:Transcriptional regulator, ROK family [Bifidobacterium saguini DSM 23967]|uniref:Transcriptional regulator, ROK family n=2 Tax=Bifidobacterium saguini TaxID=762210 RepID=A0A087DCY0_9BIFI|nr:ROK family protein [Bifidobacterium saguini]KFI93380.1 Transcriptional regulator, ROK family [Bifidobacterium saguini DSM 23967]QTB90585.1 ROK family protein [Bifidobacterium saguini]